MTTQHTAHLRFMIAIGCICYLGFQGCFALIRQSPKATATVPTSLDSLGRRLFFEQRLSANGTKSCASCHDPAFAFSDGYRRSTGLYGDPLRHNAPTLLNVRYLATLNWAAPHPPNLEAQMLRPLFGQAPPEMGLTRVKTTDPYDHRSVQSALVLLAADSAYRQQFERVFGKADDVFSEKNVVQAIAAYERTLVSFGSAYDRFVGGDEAALSVAAQRGRRLFFSQKMACATCHPPPLFTDDKTHRMVGTSVDTAFLAAFRTPTLRNVALTAPYLHDGSLEDLGALLTYFAQTGHARNAQTPSISATERLDLLVFLEHLTDSTIFHNPWFWPND
jgi:cytochrome c peroxidase